MKESVGNDQFSVKLLETHNFLMAKDTAQSAMRVYSEPLFGGEAAMFLMVALAGLMGFLAGALDKEDMNGVGFYVVVMVILLSFVSALRKRKLTAILNSSAKTIVVNKAGILGTGLFSSKKEYAQSEIKQIVVERFAKGYFGGFGVHIKTNLDKKVFITNQNLELDDAQKCAEGVREFLGLAEMC